MTLLKSIDTVTFSNYTELAANGLEERNEAGNFSSQREDGMRDVPCGPRENSAPTSTCARAVLHGWPGLMNKWGLRVKENRNK